MKNLPVVIYIHGFKSSANAWKAQLVEQYIQKHALPIEFLTPEFDNLPLPAVESLSRLIEQYLPRPVMLIGSSLGGYYARYLGHRYGLTVALVNPSVRPYDLLHAYLGLNENPYTGQQFTLTPAHMDDLKSLAVAPGAGAERTLILLQTGDEVLDALEASATFYRSACWIESGGDHQFQGFERYIGPMINWLLGDGKRSETRKQTAVE